jgi:hypothetical protein
MKRRAGAGQDSSENRTRNWLYRSLGGWGRRSVEESGRVWVGGVGQDKMSVRRPDSGELSPSRLRGSLFVSRLSNSCVVLVERSRAAGRRGREGCALSTTR